MSRRGRAIAFGLAALAAAAISAALADGYGEQVASGYGELRPVVVAGAALAVGQRIDPKLAEGLVVRQVPARFVPPGALTTPPQALGLVTRAPVPSGSYLLASELRPPGSGSKPGLMLGQGRRPVQIAVSGAGALLAAGKPRRGIRVDVVVTVEPKGAGSGRTYVAAPGVPLLALAANGEAEVAGEAEATLGLTRVQALDLIHAESFARQVTILLHG
ncbi:MAG TPA: SAF domain-containing protein [Solirubrobacterales bacterium]|jgi:Flp pilus assembly protein CpaB